MRIALGLSDKSFCSLKSLYNSKFILSAICLGTNVIIVMRVHCSKLDLYISRNEYGKELQLFIRLANQS